LALPNEFSLGASWKSQLDNRTIRTMPSEQNKKDVLREWRESAPFWAKHAEIVRSMFAPITQALIDAGGIRNGQAVLDVAGGAGEPSITLSSVVGNSGSVVFSDAVAEMVATARARARQQGQTNIEFSQCLADSIPFSSDSFDAVVCRLGVMLFPDPVAAIHEALRVLKSNGSVSYAVWSTRDSNPFFHVLMDVVSRYIESPPEDPNAPGAFRFAERGKLARVLADAGVIYVTERLLDFDLEAPLTPKEFWSLRVELSDTLRAKVAQLTREQLHRVEQEVEEAGRQFFASGRMTFPTQVLIVNGRK
jgi:SAM-dependent methyltransferase